MMKEVFNDPVMEVVSLSETQEGLDVITSATDGWRGGIKDISKPGSVS